MKKLFIALLLLLGIAQAQSFHRINPPAPGGVFRLCAVTDGNPCATPQPIFADQALTQQIVQPVQLGPDGNYGFWTLPGQYILQISSPFNRIDILNLAGPSPGGSTTTATAAFSVSPPSLQFGTVQSLQFAPGQPITITNTGVAPGVVTAILFPAGSPFSSVVTPNPCLISYAPGAACVFNVQYQPQSTSANDSSVMTISSTAPIDPQNPLQVTLTGAGTAGATFQINLASLVGVGSGTVVDTNNSNSLNAVFTAGVCTGTCAFNYLTGTTVNLVATAALGSVFGGFGGTGITTSSPSSFNVTQSQTVTASFTLAPVPVTVSLIATGQGTGTTTSNVNDVVTGNPVNCTQNAGVQTSSPCQLAVNPGTTIIFTGTPGTTGTGSCVGAPCTGPTWVGVTGCSNASTCTVTPNSNQQISVGYAPPAGAAPFARVQTIPHGTAGTNNITGNWASAQSAGDTNIVYGLWNDATTTVSGSVTDTSGNTYTQSTCSPKAGNTYTAVLYHADNIVAAAAGANTITMNLTASPSYRAMFAIEVSGLLASPVDVCAGATGPGTQIASGNMTTTVANDYLTGADVGGGSISGVSPGFTQQFIDHGNDFEDETNAPIATYNFQPTQNPAFTKFSTILAGWKIGSVNGSNITVNFVCAPGSTGSGTTTGSGVNLTCTNGVGTASQVSVGSGSTVTINSTPLSGSVFTTYVGGNCGVSPQCTTAVLTTNTTISVNFSNSGAQNYFVRTDGNDANNGLTNTAAGAWRTIAHASAVLAVGPGGTCTPAGGYISPIPNVGACVHVGSGAIATTSFTTSVNGSTASQVAYVSDTQYGATIVGNSNPVWNNTGNNVIIAGFDVSGNGTSTICIGLLLNAQNNKALGNYVHAIPGGSCAFGGAGINTPGVVPSKDNAQVIGNIVDNIGPAGPSAFIHGIYLAGLNSIVENNIVSNTAGYCIQFNHNVANEVISNNTIFNCRFGGIGMTGTSTTPFDHSSIIGNLILNTGNGTDCAIEERFGTSGVNNVYRNNLLINNSCAFHFENGSETTTGNLCSAAATGCATVITPTQANTANIFVNYTGNAKTGNYQLKAGSVAINAGVSGPCAPGGLAVCIPSVDFLNVLRPQRTFPDIGAFELP